MVDEIFAMPSDERTVLLAWMGIIGYLIQLYMISPANLTLPSD